MLESAQNKLYDPRLEHDACGIGAVVSLRGIKTHQTVDNALKIVEKLEHRAGKDAAGETGDGVGLMIQIPHLNFFQILVLLFNLVFLLVAPLAYAVYLKLQVHFDLSYANSIKLSLIGMLLDIRPVLKLILGTALLGVISYYMPALLFFVLIGVWHFFVNDIFDPVYQNIHEKLVS